MTNEITTPVLQAVASANNQPAFEIILDGGPVWPTLVLVTWAGLVLVAPLLSIGLCIRAWRRKKQGLRAPWTRRIILCCALLIATTALVYVLHELGAAFYIIGTTTPGAAQTTMLSLAISQDCTIMLIGCLAMACCLLCACWLPCRDANENVANKASESATSEPAPGAASSTPQG